MFLAFVEDVEAFIEELGGQAMFTRLVLLRHNFHL
jgi:hypothetical protein